MGMSTRRTLLLLAVAAIAWMAATTALFAAPPRAAAAPKPKYYFRIVEVNVGNHGDSALAETARTLLEKELQSRPEFTSEVASADDASALAAELKQRGLRGFRVSLRIDGLEKALRPPRPGGRLKQLAVGVKLSVFGTTFPGEKLAFGGDGEAVVVAEVVESRLEEEAVPLLRDGLTQALRQAVDQTVTKLSLPRAVPLNESKRKRRR
jgi:hypothetical protein